MYLNPRELIIVMKRMTEKITTHVKRKKIVLIFSGSSPISRKILAGIATKIVKIAIIKKSRFIFYLLCYLYEFQFQNCE